LAAASTVTDELAPTRRELADTKPYCRAGGA